MTKYELLLRLADLVCQLDNLVDEGKDDKDITDEQYQAIEVMQYRFLNKKE